MTSEQQRTAIAKACGWKVEQLASGWLWTHQDYSPRLNNGCPDYVNDLNAMRAAEHLLFSSKEPLWDAFVEHLYNIGYRGDSAAKYAIHATAAQRAEAFLRTLNLWVD